jgi:hypothetical protein
MAPKTRGYVTKAEKIIHQLKKVIVIIIAICDVIQFPVLIFKFRTKYIRL